METSCKDAAKRLLKCFCGCSDLTEDEVKRIYQFSAQETLINVQAAKLLRKFLELHRKGDKSEAEQMLDVYEKCEEYWREHRLLTEDEVEELSDLGLPYHMEKKLKENTRIGDKSTMDSCLLRIQGECRNEIEASDEFKEFKKAILIKLKKVGQR